MSSNIKVQRICQHCGQEFMARTTITLYCSHRCNSAAYKAKQRAVDSCIPTSISAILMFLNGFYNLGFCESGLFHISNLKLATHTAINWLNFG